MPTDWTMLKKAMNKQDKTAKSLLERSQEIQKENEKKDRWFEDKLKALREETRKVVRLETKNQPKSTIIGAKEYRTDNAPDKSKVYLHFAKKYGIPFVREGKKKTLENVVREIHKYEMEHKSDIIRKGVIDPVSKTYGLYIM